MSHLNSKNLLLKSLDELPDDWALTPVNNKKAPYERKWQQNPRDKAYIREQIKRGHCQAVGVLCGAPSGGLLFVDHDGESCDELIEELSGQSVAEALPPTVSVTSGRPGRSQLIYQVPPEYWEAIKTRKIPTGSTGNDGKQEQLEFRWTGCQSVVLGAHPTTGGYQWVNSPGSIPMAVAPDWITEQMLVDPLLAAVQTTEELPYEGISQTVKKDSSWKEFNQDFRLPWPDTVPLEVCLSKANRELLVSGVAEGRRNHCGAALARDLRGGVGHLERIGQRYSGDPRGLFEQYCDRCSPPIPNRERESIWKSAKRDNPGPALSPDQIEGCIKGWAWRKQRENTSAGPTSVGKVAHDAAAGAGTPSSKSLTLEQAKLRLRQAVDQGEQGSDVETLIADLSRQTGHQPQSLQRIYRELDREATLASAAKGASTALDQLRAIQGRRLPILEGLHGDSGVLARKIAQVADAMPTAQEFLVTTLIPVLATAMGTAHTLVIHATAGYTARPIFRSIIVAGTGRKKTPAQNAILQALTNLEESSALDYQEELKTYEQDYKEWQKASSAGKEDPGPEPTKPTRRRYMSQDSTLAARVQIHAENPRGLLLYKDEASAFITERGRFTSGKGDGGELESDLSEFNGGAIMTDRKGSGSTFLAKTAINRVGATQFSTLQQLMGTHNDDCGEFSRYLFCAAAAPPSKHDLTDRLIAEDHPSLQAAYPKFETYFGRFILWLHLVNAALSGKAPEPTVEGYTVELARQWTEYYIGQLKLVLAINSPQQELTGDLLKVYSYLQRKGKPLDVRAISQARLFDRAADKEKRRTPYLREMLSHLVEQGWVTQQDGCYSLSAPDLGPPWDRPTQQNPNVESKVDWMLSSVESTQHQSGQCFLAASQEYVEYVELVSNKSSPAQKSGNGGVSGNGNKNGHGATVVRDLTEAELAELLGGGGNG